MRDSLGQTTVLYAFGLALWATAHAVTGRPRPGSFRLGLAVLEVALVGQAGWDVVSLATGSSDGASIVTNLAYALTSVAVLPIAAGSVRLDPGRWGSAALSIGCLLAIVVTLRLHQTLAASRG